VQFLKIRPEDGELWRRHIGSCEEWEKKNRVPLDDLVFNGNEWALVEHVVHEVSHSVTLGLSGYEGMGNLVAAEIDALPYNGQVAAERDAWAVEYLVCQKLGIPITPQDVLDGAAIQGVEEHDMQNALDQPEWYEEDADRVLEIMCLWAEGKTD
jgi:hypothetical protein